MNRAEYGPAKQWPAEYYGQLAAARRAAGWEVWLFGSGLLGLIGIARRKKTA